MSYENISLSVLSLDELDEVRRFLYWTYCVTQAWIPKLGDPSGLRIEGDRLLDDRDHQCVHIGARLNGVLVGCIRIATRTGGLFETQLYDRQNPEGTYTLFDAEIARLSVSPTVQKQLIELKLMSATLQWTTDRHQRVFFATAEPMLMSYYQDIGFIRAAALNTFKYFKEEREAIVFCTRGIQHQRQIMSKLQDKLNSLVLPFRHKSLSRKITDAYTGRGYKLGHNLDSGKVN